MINLVNKLPIFVVQEHFATHHHFDFRLEMGGVLKSWAIPKTIPSRAGVKRLAIQVEDHPLSYATFSGIIPEGNYGAGKVDIWDNGVYELEQGTGVKYTFTLHGNILKGKYYLRKMDGNKWLISKAKKV